MSQKKLYVAKSDAGQIKVGISTKPDERVKQLSTGNPHDVIIHRTIGPLDNAEEIERVVHDEFSPDCISGEWYPESVESEINSFINGVIVATQTDHNARIEFLRDLADWNYEKKKELRQYNSYRNQPRFSDYANFLIEYLNIDADMCCACENFIFDPEHGESVKDVDECPYCGNTKL